MADSNNSVDRDDFGGGYTEADFENMSEEQFREVSKDWFAPDNHVIDTSNGKSDGLDKCPKCGSAEIKYNPDLSALQCLFCRNTWNEGNVDKLFGFDSNIRKLIGQTSGSGAGDITVDDKTVTIKCQGCGAEVVVSVDRSLQARCHWCRQTLSVNTQIPNGAVPDAILPFTVRHSEAVEAITEFVNKRRMFAWGKFKKEFEPNNVVGVYMPYMMIDGNLTGEVTGIGEHETRRYTVTVGSGDNKRQETRYDADVYSIGRKFNYTVDDLTTESNSQRADMDVKKNTNNILNAVLPFDTKNAVAYNSNYMTDFTSEKRDLNIDAIDDRVVDQFLSIARAKATDTTDFYDRGVRWETEGIAIHGTRWVAVYLPVWVYSYYVDKGNGNTFIHYVAVNGRNKKTMGSVPVSHPKLFIVSSIAAIATFFGAATTIWGGAIF